MPRLTALSVGLPASGPTKSINCFLTPLLEVTKAALSRDMSHPISSAMALRRLDEATFKLLATYATVPVLETPLSSMYW
eukprot:4720388-Pyramimonas_sp.AAC.1